MCFWRLLASPRTPTGLASHLNNFALWTSQYMLQVKNVEILLCFHQPLPTKS